MPCVYNAYVNESRSLKYYVMLVWCFTPGVVVIELPVQLCISSATNFEEPRGTKVRERDKPLNNA